VHAGAVIGADGFGFDPVIGAKGLERWDKVPQGGTVVIEDEVEIGANCTVDRGRFAATRIGRGSKLDNLVQVGHNVQMGEHVLVVSQAGIAGSAVIGRGVVLAGQSGIAPHLDIGAGARIGGGSSVFENVPAGADYIGYWARPKVEFMRTMTQVARLSDLVARVMALEEKLAKLEERAR
jgi:UDP-3-O-[3-hydroxymyristoyl] glucosamine N-acyltransferase